MDEPFFRRQKEVRIAKLAEDRYRLDGEMAKLLAQPLEKRRFALAAMPQLADSCWVFNTANDERFERGQ